MRIKVSNHVVRGLWVKSIEYCCVRLSTSIHRIDGPELKVILAGTKIDFCPFCGARIEFFVDKSSQI